MPVHNDKNQRETLSFGSIVINVIYSILLLATALISAIGLSTYQWVETDKDTMAEGQLFPPPEAPGFQSVSCGLGTYCINAAGTVSECSLPWPRYGDGNATDVPIFLWTVAAGFIAVGIVFVMCAWLFTLIACFGCYSHQRQNCCAKIVDVGGLFMFIGLMCFGASFSDLAVTNEDCRIPVTGGGNCESSVGWFIGLPSEQIKGSVENISCRICPENTAAFQMSSLCSFGWGGILVVVGCVMCFVSSAVGHCVTPRKFKEKIAEKMRQRRMQA